MISLQLPTLYFMFGFASSTRHCVDKRWAFDWNHICNHNPLPVKKSWPRCCFTQWFFTLLFTVIRQKLVRCGGHGNECGYCSNVKYTAAISHWAECPETPQPHLHQWTHCPGWTQTTRELDNFNENPSSHSDKSNSCMGISEDTIANLSSLLQEYNYKTY